MKKQNIIVGIIIIVIIVIIAIVAMRGGSSPAAQSGTTGVYIAPPTGPNSTATTTTPIPATEIATSSNGLSQYVNNELGFSVNYPTAWTIANNSNGPIFTIPTTGKSQNSITILQAGIYYSPGVCAFPPVATSTIQKQSVVTVGSLSFNMLSVVNSAAGMNYNDRMYTLQQSNASNKSCLIFSFGAVAKTSSSSVVTADNSSIVTAADTAFTALVKSFAFVTGAAGQSESAHPNGQ
jgi:hypothetical protein